MVVRVVTPDAKTADLWVDGVCFKVPIQVATHVKFINDLNERYATRLSRPPAPDDDHGGYAP